MDFKSIVMLSNGNFVCTLTDTNGVIFSGINLNTENLEIKRDYNTRNILDHDPKIGEVLQKLQKPNFYENGKLQHQLIIFLKNLPKKQSIIIEIPEKQKGKKYQKPYAAQRAIACRTH